LFSALVDAPVEAEAEWHSFATAVQQSAASSLDQQQRKPQRRSVLSEDTLSVVHRKQVAFLAWQQQQQLLERLAQQQLVMQQAADSDQWERSEQQRQWRRQHAAAVTAAATAKRAYSIWKNRAARRVQRDQHRRLAADAAYAEQLWKRGHLSAFHKHVQGMFKEKQAAVGSAGILSKDGATTLRSAQEQLGRFQEHFQEVFSSDSVSAEQQQLMEQLIAGVEASLQGRNSGECDTANPAAAPTSRGSSNNSSSSGGSLDDIAAAAVPPSADEVAEAMAALRNGAAAGVDCINAPLLKAGPLMATWLHRVICAVWVSGKAPVDWKCALLVPLHKSKGSAKLTGNHRPNSLLRIPGKVYALLLLSMVNAQIEPQLLDCQSAFRKSRGLSDAVFTLRMLMSKCREYKQPLYMAFVDLSKAYDTIPRALCTLVRVACLWCP
jgi:hypothetical protein